METLFIVDTKNYKGQVESTISVETVDISGYLHNNQDPDLTVSEYMSKLNNPDLEVMSWGELEARLHSPFMKSLQGPWKEVSEDQFDDMLNCLPPRKWLRGQIEQFFMGECYSADLYLCCIKDHKTTKCYSALRSIFNSGDKIQADYLAFKAQLPQPTEA